VLAVQNLLSTDREDAIRCYELLEAVVGRINLTAEEAKLFAESLISEGRLLDVENRLWDLPLGSQDRALIRADLANPFIQSDTRQGSVEVWLKLLEAAMGFVPAPGLVGLREDVGKPFDRLTGAKTVRNKSGPLVTVILTTFRRDEALLTAVRSILQQSWEAIELLVVDDGSPPEFSPWLSKVEEMDARVRVIRLGKNEGTYRARNVGLAAATGEFATIQDSDDWSHPLRIESQVLPMLNEPSLVATTSACVRANDDLVLTSTGYQLIRLNTSSLMIRLNEVIGRVGFMDGVRKGADSEYLKRIQLVFDGGYEHLPGPALSVIRRGLASLSRSDFDPGWHHPARSIYKGAYASWHSRVESGASPYIEMRPKQRHFPAPPTFLSEQPGPQNFDVVFVGDWREFGGPQKSMIEEIRSLREVGARIGVAHMESLRYMTSRPAPSLCEPVREMERMGEVSSVFLDDELSADLVSLRYPPILQFPPQAKATWDIQRLWVVANQAPSEVDGSDVRYIPDDCDANARSLFGIEPVWIPQSDRIRSTLQDRLPRGSLAPFNNPGIIRSDEWYTEHLPDPRGPIRLGRYSRDNLIKFPNEPEKLMAAYPADEQFSVSMMGARDSLEVILGTSDVPRYWTILETNAVPVKEFLQSIDFFVYFNNSMTHEAFGRSLLEAIASGVVVVADRYHESTFGPAAVYCDPSEVRELLRRLAADPDSYRSQVRKAQEIVRERFSPEAFRRIVAADGLIGAP
jgi:hypothetical protein